MGYRKENDGEARTPATDKDYYREENEVGSNPHGSSESAIVKTRGRGLKPGTRNGLYESGDPRQPTC